MLMSRPDGELLVALKSRTLPSGENPADTHDLVLLPRITS